jgi:hypothetical protein
MKVERARGHPCDDAPGGEPRVSSSDRSLRIGERTVPLEAGAVVLGSDAGCDIVLEGERVADRHARIHVGRRVEIEDLGSPAGVLVNGSRIVERARLAHRAVIALGDVKLVMLEHPRSTRTTSALRAAKSGSGVRPLGQSAAELPAAVERLERQLSAPGAAESTALVHTLRELSRATLELAASTREPGWIDRLLRAHARLEKVLDWRATTGLENLVRAIGCDEAALAAYVAAAAKRAPTADEEARLQRAKTLLAELPKKR